LPIAQLKGVDTHYEVEGEGVPVLFIHGGFGGAESTLFPRPSVFRDVLDPLRFQTITYDRRGSGRSTYVQKPYGLRELAGDALALLDHLDVRRAIVVGDSLGGIVAQRLALDAPGRVQSLVLVETAARILQVSWRIRAFLLASRVLPVRPFFPFARKRVLNPTFYEPLGPLTAEEIERRRLHHAEYRGRLAALPDGELRRFSVGLLRNYDAFVGTDLRQEVGRILGIVDIIHGTADKVISFERGVELSACIPGSRLHPLADVGHGVFYYPEGRQLVGSIIAERVAQSSAVR
jgi:3-oxoadipate enol-lactonase